MEIKKKLFSKVMIKEILKKNVKEKKIEGNKK